MNSLIFDEKKKEFTILDGSLGKYSFYDVVSSQIVYEDAKYKDKSPMFSHRVLVSTFNHSIFIEMKKVYCFNRFVLFVIPIFYFSYNLPGESRSGQRNATRHKTG